MSVLRMEKVTVRYDGVPALDAISLPLEVSGKVKFVFDGCYRTLGPMCKGLLNNTGTTVVLDTGKVEIVIVSRHQEPFAVELVLDPFEVELGGDRRSDLSGPQMQHLAWKVPVVQRLSCVDSLITLQPDQLGPARKCQSSGQ